jgi:ketosteroid isomerase-like protein
VALEPTTAPIQALYDATHARDVRGIVQNLADDCVMEVCGAWACMPSVIVVGPHDIVNLFENLILQAVWFYLEGLYSDGQGHVVAIHRLVVRHPDRPEIDAREAVIFVVRDGLIRSIRHCPGDLRPPVQDGTPRAPVRLSDAETAHSMPNTGGRRSLVSVLTRKFAALL